MEEGGEKLNKSVANFQVSAALLKEADEIARSANMSRSDILRQAIRLGLPLVKTRVCA